MVGLADENGRTYECKYGTYSVAEGFKFNENVEPIIEDHGWREMVDILFHENLWKLKKEPVKKMTLKEIEKELGYKIELAEDDSKKVLSPEKQKEIEDYIDLIDALFGFKTKDRED